MAAIFHESGSLSYVTSSLLDAHGVPHAFFTRFGGISDGVFSSLNVSLNRKDRSGATDQADCVRENLSRAAALFGKNLHSVAMMKQVHSALLCDASVSCRAFFDNGEPLPDCDALLTENGASIDALGVKTADCVPVLLYDIRNDTAVALHAGWRGTVAGLCAVAVNKMKKRHADAEILAAIGPCIGACCYEVSREVYDAAKAGFSAFGVPSESLSACFPTCYYRKDNEKFRADLTEINRAFLLASGILPANIDVLSLCTCCYRQNGDYPFFSHRRSGGFSGTQLSFLAVR